MTHRLLHRWAWTALTTIGLLASASARAADDPTLNFGIISTESSQAQEQLFEPFLADMAEQTGLEVKPFFATDYAGVIQAMRFDKVDVAWFGNKAAMEAVDRAGGEIFAQTVADNGDPGYWSLMIVNQNSPYHSVDEVLEHASELTFGNGDPNSTSGYLVPGYYIFAKRGIDASQAFKRTLNASHETNALTVANGHVDVATFNTESMARLRQTNPEAAAKLRVIWKSPLIPSDPIVWRQDLPDATQAKVRDFFMNYGQTPEEKQVLASLQWAPFAASSNDQLLPIRQLALFQQRTQVAADDSLDDSERQAQLEAIDAQLADIDQRMAAQSDDTSSQATTDPASAGQAG